MSCMTSAAWNRHVSSPCYTEHGQRCGAILSDHITTIVMSMNDQVDLCCTIELNCSGMSTRLTGTSVTRDRALNTCEPSYVPGAARSFFIPMVHSPLRVVGYVAAPELSSQGAKSGPRGSVETHLGRETRSGAKEHVAASELSFRGGRTQSHGTHGSVKAHLNREMRCRAEKYVTAPKLNSVRR
jgi:hypothetical protein